MAHESASPTRHSLHAFASVVWTYAIEQLTRPLHTFRALPLAAPPNPGQVRRQTVALRDMGSQCRNSAIRSNL
jgi:hypothetical protein